MKVRDCAAPQRLSDYVRSKTLAAFQQTVLHVLVQGEEDEDDDDVEPLWPVSGADGDGGSSSDSDGGEEEEGTRRPTKLTTENLELKVAAAIRCVWADVSM
jgi:hypothetical protein